MAGRGIYRGQQAVSIITCTKRRYCMETLFHNYNRQNYTNKELIVILNNDSLKISEYIQAAKFYKNVRIFSLPDHASLGSCLNYGVQLSKYSYIAKFDDDDYYAPDYLTDSMRLMAKTHADIVGKRAHYMYLSGKKLLLHRYYQKADQYVSMVQGATLLVKKRVFSKVHFPNQTRGECVKFCSNSLARGFKIYAGNPRHFAAIRRKNSTDHTWIVSDNDLLARGVKVVKAGNIRRFVSRG
ncbi:Glycosyltransferases, probably involved in cell wall biogenesis [Paenibacillus uliginis N3/975]|uniref:Glycosyltransferases, probably involved in cell wall biogenesis n=1 Tax=Paenibacillus uliginis N3/975 TaxID=1313296 RepID=A0A1X7HTV1_9BACL|nr:glycosyltransferase [Paenibacillus uliginis]SMF92974.1 Glycosyltransferases, probably involved in cell wall biogenesis [Paenibacillus uliginis N3/975]